MKAQNKKIFYLCPREVKNKHTNTQTHKQNHGKPFSDYENSPWETRNCFSVARWGPIPTPGSSVLPFSWPSHLPSPSTSPFASCVLPSLCCCSPLILCCLFDFLQFPSNSCLQQKGRAVDILQAEGWAGLGLSSWVMAGHRTRGHTATPGQQFLHQSLVMTWNRGVSLNS